MENAVGEIGEILTLASKNTAKGQALLQLCFVIARCLKDGRVDEPKLELLERLFRVICFEGGLKG